MKYRKKPVVIKAIQWTGKNHQEVKDFFGTFNDWICIDGKIKIRTLEGDHFSNVKDYIIKGVKGEFYPCKPDIFKRTYEKVE